MEWKSDGWWEWWWWQQVNEEVSRDMTGEADGMNLEVDSKDEATYTSDLWRILAICDFQWGDGW